MMTINEYKDLHDLTYRELAEHLGATINAVQGWLRGGKAKAENAKSFERLGINHPIVEPKDYVSNNKRKEKEKKMNMGILKYFQIHAVKTYGNTIVSKKHSPEGIINAFASIGINVKVREYNIPDVCVVEIRIMLLKDFNCELGGSEYENYITTSTHVTRSS